MSYQWIQQRTRKGEMQKWVLVHKETRVVVLEMWFSAYAEHWENHKLRRKIQMQYELYFQKVWLRTLRFF